MTDPTFAAIEAHQQADHLLEQASGAAADAAAQAEMKSAEKLLDTMPTTEATTRNCENYQVKTGVTHNGNQQTNSMEARPIG